MVTSQNGIDLITKFEGLRLKAYQDAVGVWTIGYGHTAGVTEGQEITKATAVEFLTQDLAAAEEAVSSKPYDWNQNEFDALVSFTFNCGRGNLTKLLKKNTRTKEEIAAAFLLYNKAGGKELAGLTKRRKAERALFERVATDADYYPAYTEAFGHLDTILLAIGVPAEYTGNYTRRAPLAYANGIPNYNGTLKENMQLIQLARTGKLRRIAE